MLERVVHENGVVTYQSPLLAASGVPHAFSTRIGGASPPPFASLNLGNTAGCAQQDDPAHLVKNYQRLQAAIGAADALRCWVRQVHGNAVGLIEPEGEGEYAEPLDGEVRDRWSGQTEADALLTDQPGLLLTVRVADCFPLLLASADGHVVAAVHAGWRGVVGHVVPRAIQAMTERGVPMRDVRAAIGPGISAEHFEVGDEVVREFARAELGAFVRQTPGARPHIDLQAAIAAQLTVAGVRNVDTNACCTVRNELDFFSHRRDHGLTGRMAAVIMRRKEG